MEVDVVLDTETPVVDVEVANRAGGINKIVHDETLVGDGVKEPLAVNPDIIPDVSGFATKDDLAGKADKSDIPDTSAFATKDDLAGKADKSEIPTVPTRTSQLTNDSGFITDIPSEYVTEKELADKGYLTEHQDVSGKADKSEIPDVSGFVSQSTVETMIDNAIGDIETALAGV